MGLLSVHRKATYTVLAKCGMQHS